MRILFVPKEFPSAARPQSGIFILRRVQAVARLGHQVRVLVPVPYAPPIGKAKWRTYNAIPEFENVEGIDVHAVRVLTPPRMLGAEYLPLLLHRALMREIDSFRPDIVHASFLLPCGQLVVRQRLVPAIVTAHGFDAYNLPNRRPGLRAACAEAISKATRVTAVSAYIAGCLRQIVSREVDVIWNGAQEEIFFPRDRAACRAELGLPHDRVVVVFAGYLLRAKGVFELADALAAMPQSQRPLVLYAGDGPARAELQARIDSYRIDARILGAQPHARMGTIFGAADVITLPSHAEGLPNVICEAMLSRRAIVASTAGGIPEIVRSGQTGLLVAPQQPQELSIALTRLCTDTQLRESLAHNARDFAARELTWETSARRYERLYQEAV